MVLVLCLRALGSVLEATGFVACVIGLAIGFLRFADPNTAFLVFLGGIGSTVAGLALMGWIDERYMVEPAQEKG